MCPPDSSTCSRRSEACLESFFQDFKVRFRDSSSSDVDEEESSCGLRFSRTSARFALLTTSSQEETSGSSSLRYISCWILARKLFHSLTIFSCPSSAPIVS